MKKFIIWSLVSVVVLLVVALVAAFFSLNLLVKKGVETYGPEITKVDVKLEAAQISIFSGSGQLINFLLGNPQGYKANSAFQVANVKLGVQIGSVLSDTIVVNEINIQSPEITLEGTLDGNNLMTILNNIKGTNAAKETPAKPAAAASTNAPGKQKMFIVKDIVLNGAKVHLNVSGFGKTLDKTVTIPDIHLQNVGTAQNAVTPAQLAQQILEPVLTSALKVAAQELAGKELNKALDQGQKELNKVAPGLSNVVPGLTNLIKF